MAAKVGVFSSERNFDFGHLLRSSCSVADMEKEWRAGKDSEMEERLNDLRVKLGQDRVIL